MKVLFAALHFFPLALHAGTESKEITPLISKNQAITEAKRLYFKTKATKSHKDYAALDDWYHEHKLKPKDFGTTHFKLFDLGTEITRPSQRSPDLQGRIERMRQHAREK